MPYKPEKEPKENKSVEELEKKIDGLVSNYERSIKELRREIRSRDSDIEGLMSRNSDQQRTIEQLEKEIGITDLSGSKAEGCCLFNLISGRSAKDDKADLVREIVDRIQHEMEAQLAN